MTAEEKYEETKKKVQKLTEELPSIASKFENTISAMEDSHEKIYQKAKDAAKLGDSRTAQNTIKMAARMKCFSLEFKNVQSRLNNCESALQALGDVSCKKMETIEKALEALLTSCNDAKDMASILANLKKSLCELESILEIDAVSDENLCNDDSSAVADELAKCLMNDLSTDLPFFDDSIDPEADAFTKMMLEKTENDDSSAN